jgi:hypothetical protein
VVQLVVVHTLRTTQRLCWLELHRPDLAVPEVPVLDGRHLVLNRTEGRLEAVRLVEVETTAHRGLVW